MKLVSCADIHLGNHRRFGGAEQVGLNVRCRHALDAFRAAVTLARARGAGALVVQGDLFDYSHAEPQLIAAVQRVLAEARTVMEVVLLVGNHDQDSTHRGDHALAPLEDYATVVDAPLVLPLEDNQALVELVCLPYNPDPAAEWLDKALGALCPEPPERRAGKVSRRVLAVHLGIADEETPPWLRGARDSVHIDALSDACVRHHVDLVLAGNWHNHARWEDPGYATVVQVGALAPTGWDNPGLDGLGGVAEYDALKGAVEMHFVPGPRFVTARSVAELQDVVAQGRRRGHKVYAQATLPREETAAALAYVQAAKASGELEDGEVLVDATEAKAAARTAAHAARQADTLEEAIAASVKAMNADDGVDRARVIARVMGYLRAAKGAA